MKWPDNVLSWQHDSRRMSIVSTFCASIPGLVTSGTRPDQLHLSPYDRNTSWASIVVVFISGIHTTVLRASQGVTIYVGEDLDYPLLALPECLISEGLVSHTDVPLGEQSYEVPLQQRQLH